jgi:hypothetical protein
MTVKTDKPGAKRGEKRGQTGKHRLPPLSDAAARKQTQKPWEASVATTDPFLEAGPEWEEEAGDVEALAGRQRTKPTDLPVSRGDLSKRPFAELLAEIYRWRADGALVVTQAQAKKVVYFRKGRPVFVKSNAPSECLGRILIGERLITEADCEESLSLMKASGRLQGTVLVEMGRISPHNLTFALGLQLQAKLFDLFGWQEGRFELDRRAEMPLQPIELEMTTAAIIYGGIQRAYSDGRVASELRDVRDLYPVPAADPLYRFQELGLDADEAKLVGAIDGSRTTGQLEQKSPLRPMVVRRLLLAMRIAQVLEFDMARHTGVHKLRLAPPPLKPKPAAPPAQAVPPKLPPARTTASTLAAEVASLRNRDPFGILRITRTATPDEIRRAYLDLAKAYHPDKHYSSASAEVRDLAAEIYNLISEAYETLSNPGDRSRYEAGGSAPASNGNVANVLAAEGKFQRGEQLLRQDRFKEAAAAFAEAVALYGEEGEFHAYLGWSLFRANPGSAPILQQALDHIERALRLNPKVDTSYLFLGYIEQATGRPDKAERSFEKALQCNPDCLEALHELRLMTKPRRR